MTDKHQHNRWQELIPHAIRGYRGIQLTAAYFAACTLLSLGLGLFTEGFFASLFLYSFAGAYAWTAYALFSVRKSGWHFACFFAFVTIVLNIISLACAPRDIAAEEMNLFEVAFDMLTLVLSFIILTYLRRPDVREIYGVPLSYGLDEDGPG